MTTLLAVIDISQRPWIVESRQIPEYESRVQYAQKFLMATRAAFRAVQQTPHKVTFKHLPLW